MQPLATYGGPWHLQNASMPPDDHGTSHMAVADSQGGAVAITTTVNTGFGSKVISPSTGKLLEPLQQPPHLPGTAVSEQHAVV